MVGLAESLDLDGRAVRHLQHLRVRYGRGPLMLRTPGNPRALILAPEDVFRVLDNSPEPFATASREKRAALDHFEPKNALVSHGCERSERRRFNEIVLETEKPVHTLAETFRSKIEDEIQQLMDAANETHQFDWPAFTTAWGRIVRRLVLGDDARDDHSLTDMLADLRRRANWAFFQPIDTNLRDRFHRRLQDHLDRAAPGSLGGIIGTLPQNHGLAPSHQVAQWLFAFDPGGMATFRTLALLATYPGARERASTEIDGADAGSLHKPYLRACFMESLRLWPTTPVVLRETTVATRWNNCMMPAGTGVFIFAPYFHRDEERLTFAHRFAPEIWLRAEDPPQWPLIPFSRGPAVCPAHNFVPCVAALSLAAMLRRRVVLQAPARLDPLPGTLDNYSLRFAIPAPRSV